MIKTSDLRRVGSEHSIGTPRMGWLRRIGHSVGGWLLVGGLWGGMTATGQEVQVEAEVQPEIPIEAQVVPGAEVQVEIEAVAVAEAEIIETAAAEIEPEEVVGAKEPLTLESIYESNDFDEESFGKVTWYAGGDAFHMFDKAAAGGSGRDWVRVNIETGEKDVILPSHVFTPTGETRPIAVEDWEVSADGSRLLLFTNSRRVWRLNTRGDYWVLDITTRELRRLGGEAAPSTLMFAKFSPDGMSVAYVHQNNLYVQSLRDMSVVALTTDDSSNIINGTFDWVYEEELGLHRGFEWSPKGDSIAYWQIDTTGVREYPLVNTTDGLYPKMTLIPYPKTGEQNSSARIGVVSVDGGETQWLEIPGDSRNNYLARMQWTPDGSGVLVQQFNRLQNTNQVWLAQWDRDIKLVWTESDEAWVDNQNSAQWLGEGRECLWLSERDGWSHAYRLAMDTGKLSRVTGGAWDLIDVQAVDEAGGWLYYTASPGDATRRYLYRVPLEGGSPERVTPDDQSGTHSYRISPNARWALHTYSTFGRPPVIQWVSLPDHEPVRAVRDNWKVMDRLERAGLPGVEFFQVEIPDGNDGLVSLDGWCLRPADFDPARKYPVLFFVYGEPAGQTVLDRWRGKNGLWHLMLAQQGYVIVSVDNRGTPAPKGREWRKVTYRQVGILNASDQAAAVRALSERWPWMDADRVGIWGWSGGGSSTLNAMFQYPDVYRMGISVAPVPNQRLYDTIYQERYMGLPSENMEGYRLGSPITHAHQLKGDLLVIHGTGDDNCHYQGTEALINELIAHKKVFSMMAYPNRSHSISEGPNVKYHLFSLMTRFLHEHLPR